MHEIEPSRPSTTATHAALDAVPAAVVFSDPESGRILHANARAVEILDRSLDALVGSPEFCLYENPEVRYAIVEGLVRARGVHDFEVQLRRPDGTPFWLQGSYALVDLDGRRALASSFTDVDRARRHRISAEGRFSGLLGRHHVGVVRLDADGELLHANEAALRQLGAESRSAAKELPLTEILLPEGREYDELLRGDARPGAYEYEVSHTAAGGVMVARVTAAPSTGREGQPVLDLLVEDVGERRSIERRLYHARKMEALGRLAGGVAHDFNNVLSVIMSFASMAQSDLDDREQVREDLDEVVRAAREAAGLTRRLLDFARKEPAEVTRFDLSDHAADTAAMLTRMLGGGVRVESRRAHHALPVRMSSTELEMVLLNLAMNARDAMPDGGTLAIDVRPCMLDVRRKEALGMDPGSSYAEIAVSDTGHGMDEATRTRIFEPFFTTKEGSKGTGLGLSTCRGAIRQAGGTIRVLSEPGRGTTFKIYLPLDRADRDDGGSAGAEGMS